MPLLGLRIHNLRDRDGFAGKAGRSLFADIVEGEATLAQRLMIQVANVTASGRLKQTEIERLQPLLIKSAYNAG